MKWTGSLIAMSMLMLSVFTLVSRAEDLPGLRPETVADYIHAVIEADRTFYTVHVVERMQKQGGASAAENWRAKKKVLPLPAQFLAESSELASKTGGQVRYRLISLWPINPQNRPASESERKGLEEVREHPEQASTSTITIGDQRYFQAIYGDRAVSQACIGCHNAHPRSPKRDFKLNDMMGGMVIEIPLSK